ncbi:MAG: lytic transglycosylase domain-containing protein [Oscillospiraceae bacterium]|nr:lytic transglycosylase domain-containing protein [Oscillospiraceae bacterium]
MTDKKFKITRTILILLIIAVTSLLLVNIGLYLHHEYLLKTHPLEYSDLVEKYAQEHNLDKYLIYAVIKTESSFNPEAESHMGARGLMQIMPDTFDWLKDYRKLDGETFDDMFIPEVNIQHGSYLIAYHMGRYNNINNSLAAYHAGNGNVNEWLQNPEYSADGISLDKIPAADTAHYVNKVNKAYETYKELYRGN